MNKDRFPYRAYLLRLWAVKDDPDETLRASLEDPRTREIKTFPSLEALFTYLRQEMGIEEEVPSELL